MTRALRTTSKPGKQTQARAPWIEDVYAHVAAGRDSEAIDVIFTKMNSLFQAGRWRDADDILEGVDLKRLNLSVIVGLLSFTKRAVQSLKRRPRLVARAWSHLAQTEPERAHRLIARLVGRAVPTAPQTYGEAAAEAFWLIHGEEPSKVETWTERVRSTGGKLHFAKATRGPSRGVHVSFHSAFYYMNATSYPEVIAWRGLRRNGDERVILVKSLDSVLHPELDNLFGDE